MSNIFTLNIENFNNLKGEMLMEKQARKKLVRETIEKHLNELRNELVELGLKGWFNFGYESREEGFSIGCDYNLAKAFNPQK